MRISLILSLLFSACSVARKKKTRFDQSTPRRRRYPRLLDWRSDEVRAHSDADLDRILHEGAGKVSASAHKSKALSADDIGNVVAFIRSLK